MTVSAPPPPGPPVPEQAPPPAPKGRPRWQWIAAGIGVLLVIGLVGSALRGPAPQAPGTPATRASTPAPPAATRAAVAPRLGARADVIAFLGGIGFSGALSPLNSGEERWLGRDPSGFIGEVIGPAEAADRLSLTISITTETSEQAGTTTGLVLGRYASWSSDWAIEQVQTLDTDPNLEASLRQGAVEVRLTGFVVGEEALVTITVDHD